LPYLEDHPAYKRRFAQRRRRLSGNIYSLLCLWAPEFYHWFHDVLPRLETALPHLPADTKFLINSNPKQWQVDSLTAFGIKSDQLEIQLEGMHTRVERLWFATPVGHTTLGSGAVIKRVANRLRRRFVEDNSEEKLRRLHISRRKTDFRRIVNENEIIPLLEERGFETVVCEELSLREQIKLFSANVAMVGVHGAGLTNLIYCSPGSYIGEIHAGFVFPHYLVTARQFGLRFSRFEADPAGESDIDMRVNAAAFRAWLSERLEPLRQKVSDPDPATNALDIAI
jgi:capsular polysaccharide biosynthesis protein